MKPYFQFYLVGCILTIVLILFKLALNWAISWFTRDNILLKNLRKIQPPEKSLGVRVGMFFLVLATEALLSWINVAIVLWQILLIVITTIRNSFSYKPEAIKKILYPLKNNSDLQRETVWAYSIAFAIHYKAQQLDDLVLANELNQVSEYYPTFNQKKALRELEILEAVKPEAIAAAMDVISRPKITDEP